ncbi:hypothetical protein EYE42_10370 [Paracoccus subflavus]|uniref:Uncharacterized protein n=1 Tax=Paracoccus subflavus TaxID=2528244 RepID=A0A4V2JC52_9RHOB|nr:hypothetical protein [Paracoccus subflavus]TBN39423.1 hypothetical protein EYE42_10370 [Paracoccus subflavus]
MSEKIYLASATAFVASSAVLATLGRPPMPVVPPLTFETLPDGMMGPLADLPMATLPQLYIQPQNAVMWLLLVVLWLLLLADAVGQYLDPSDQNRVWPPLSLALLTAAIWPWLVGISTTAAMIGAMLMLAASLTAAVRARGQRRPGPGFMAGWSLTLGTATLATLATEPIGLSTSQTAIVAILPSALIGMFAQEWLGRSITFAVATIWAFCAVAVTTMGTSPGVALAAIIGISGMGVVLVRAAT